MSHAKAHRLVNTKPAWKISNGPTTEDHVGRLCGLAPGGAGDEGRTIFWTIVLGIIGSIIGGGVTYMFLRPTNGRYHPAGLIFSTLGAILVLFICYKLNIHFPQVHPF